MSSETKSFSRGKIEELIEEIQVVVGLNFENGIIKEHLETNNFDFLNTITSLISKFFKKD
jgi:hypothetical protein